MSEIARLTAPTAREGGREALKNAEGGRGVSGWRISDSVGAFRSAALVRNGPLPLWPGAPLH